MSSETRTPPATQVSAARRGARMGLPLGAALFAVMLLLPAPPGLDQAAWRTAAVGVLMGVWWMTEALPIAATALLPIALFPPLGIAPIGATTAPYANPVIFLFMGGFMLALALEKCGLHSRIALAIVARVGTRPANLVAGFMLATAALSMWVSNTAAVVMMLPVAQSLVALMRRQSAAAAGDVGAGGSAAGRGFAVALMLGIAYAASIGGVGTLIGTPPNALLAGFMEEVYGVRIGFAEWMLFGVPVVLLTLPLTWLLLVRLFGVGGAGLSGGAALVRQQRAALGAISTAERRVAVIATLMALAWTFQPLLGRVLPGLSDAGIAMAGALALFITPAGVTGAAGAGALPGGRTLEWEDTRALPWGVLVLFGGGLSLAAAIESTGLAAWIGQGMLTLQGVPVFVVALLVTTVIVFLTELTSNTATAAAFLPIVAAAAVALGVPAVMLAIPAVIGASCAFMMPVATPPNALVYASGDVSMRDMMRAGIWLNVIMIVLINLLVFLAAGWLPGTR